MRQSWNFCGLLFIMSFAQVNRAASQTNAAENQNDGSYRLSVSVDEVSLTFHAADVHGLPIKDLTVDELHLRDNGRPPRKIVAFEYLHDFPIRTGILMDRSQSMQETRSDDRAVAIRYTQQVLRRQTDQAFVMNFGYVSDIAQPWTTDTTALTEGIRNRKVIADSRSHMGGTALFDAVYRACLNQFGHIANAGNGNLVLLFSDGEDNASHTSLKQAVDTCKRTNTAIYAFHPKPKADYSTGPAILEELASKSGGRVFYDDVTEAEIDSDLRVIEADLRSRYLLVYKPAELKHDGSFHHIELNEPERVDRVAVRSGYYAPAN